MKSPSVEGHAAEPPRPEILARPGGPGIAYHRFEGLRPGIMFLGGFHSDMTGSKAMRLDAWCRTEARSFLRFDYSGHGASGGLFEDGTIGQWFADAMLAFDRLTRGPQILVGSSMGGWLAVLIALARPERVAALVGIAAAPDFTEDLMPLRLGEEGLARLREDGVFWRESAYDSEPYPITARLLEEGRRHLVLRRNLPIHVPVRLIHGTADPDVPWQTSLRLADRLASRDVEVLLVKDGDHRLSETADLDRLTGVVGRLVSLVSSGLRC